MQIVTTTPRNNEPALLALNSLVCRLVTTTITVALLLIVTACGQKGALYLPQDQTVDTAAISTELEQSRPLAEQDKPTEKPAGKQ